MLKRFLILVVCCIAMLCFGKIAGGELSLPTIIDGAMLGDHLSDNGWYSTIGSQQISGGVLKGVQTLELDVPDMREHIKVQSILLHKEIVKKNGGAQLVIVLNGTSGLATGGFATYIMGKLKGKGVCSMSPDSMFTPGMVRAVGRGVPGNFRRECYSLIDIINAYRQAVIRDLGADYLASGNSVHIIGISYGGIEALLLPEVLAAMKNPPFKIASVTAISPPINLEESIGILDYWHPHANHIPDAKCRSLMELYFAFGTEKKKFTNPMPAEYENSDDLKMALSSGFKYNLGPVVEETLRLYGKDLAPVAGTLTINGTRWPAIPNFENENLGLSGESANARRSYWAKEIINFRAFYNNYCKQYWSQVQKVPDDILADGNLTRILRNVPPEVKVAVMISNDDPLNTSAAVAAFKRELFPANEVVAILPKGGHCGALNCGLVTAAIEKVGAMRESMTAGAEGRYGTFLPEPGKTEPQK